MVVIFTLNSGELFSFEFRKAKAYIPQGFDLQFQFFRLVEVLFLQKVSKRSTQPHAALWVLRPYLDRFPFLVVKRAKQSGCLRIAFDIDRYVCRIHPINSLAQNVDRNQADLNRKFLNMLFDI